MMTRTRQWTVLALCSWLAGCQAEQPVVKPSIDHLVAAAKAVGEPDFDPARKQEPGYVDTYKRAQHRLYRRKASILLAALEHYPDDQRTPEIMERRWKLLGWNQDPNHVAAEVLADIDAVLDRTDHPEIERHASYWRAFYRIHVAALPEDKFRQANVFVGRYPADERGADLLKNFL